MSSPSSNPFYRTIEQLRRGVTAVSSQRNVRRTTELVTASPRDMPRRDSSLRHEMTHGDKRALAIDGCEQIVERFGQRRMGEDAVPQRGVGELRHHRDLDGRHDLT